MDPNLRRPLLRSAWILDKQEENLILKIQYEEGGLSFPVKFLAVEFMDTEKLPYTSGHFGDF